MGEPSAEPAGREAKKGGGSFFALGRGDLVFLGFFGLLSAVGFLIPLIPSLGSARPWGVALFGWWMAGLMIVVPLLALWRSARDKEGEEAR